MDNQTAKEILSVYRPGGEDAADPLFKDALLQCEKDPAMRAWFDEQRAFDTRIASALETIRAPESGKRAILALAETGQAEGTHTQGFWRRQASWLALAACLALAFFGAVALFQTQQDVRADSPASLTEMISSAMPLEFRHPDPGRLLDWLKERGAPVSTALASKITGTPAAGCRIFKTHNGGAVSLVCLEVDRQLVHVFIYDDKARRQFEGPMDNWWQEEGYNLIAKENGGQLIAYATRAAPGSVAHLL